MIADYVKELVESDCGRTENEFGTAFFKQHILIVREFAVKLAEILGADREVVEIASYLHDISAVRDINTLSRHSDMSAEIAGSILEEKSYDAGKIESVKKTIRSHSVPVQIGEGTLEEICVSNADAMSQIINPTYWLFFAFSVKKMTYEQGVEWYIKRIRMNKKSLIGQARNLINKRYSLVKSLVE